MFGYGYVIIYFCALPKEEISLAGCEVFVDPFEEAEAKVSIKHEGDASLPPPLTPTPICGLMRVYIQLAAEEEAAAAVEEKPTQEQADKASQQNVSLSFINSCFKNSIFNRVVN